MRDRRLLHGLHRGPVGVRLSTGEDRLQTAVGPVSDPPPCHVDVRGQAELFALRRLQADLVLVVQEIYYCILAHSRSFCE